MEKASDGGRGRNIGNGAVAMTESVCPRCYGSGAIELERTHMGIPITRPCQCLTAKDIVRNLNRGWPGLSSAGKLERTPLTEYTGEDLYLTASDEALRAHLRHAAIRMGPWWGFKVVSDSDLMTAWLAPIALVGKEVIDPDAASVSTEKATLVDLTDPPDLLIIRLGVKSARNSAMSEVFLEALQHRAHIGKPTWVVDQPMRKLALGHMCFSDEVVGALARWNHVTLEGVFAEVSDRHDRQSSPPTPTSLSLGSSPGMTATRRVEMPEQKQSKKRFTKRDE